MRTTGTIIFAFILLVLQSAFSHLVPWDMFVPNAALTIVLYMGLHDHDLGRGALVSFVIGYMMDAFAGSPIGLFTFVSVTVFLVSKVAAWRLFLQGWIFEIILAYFLAIVAGGVILGIRALFDQDFGSLLTHAKIVGLRAVATALVAPFVFRGMRWIEQFSATAKRNASRGKVIRR
ncbi:MAG: rod shape-determining protein MreD [Deltaproteobacteria bacterium]|nr:rod shape-determining protein MreD [Deltaproteobacteria bacterium]MBN2670868.1 rod shape-determining protein MreD [Deltaproteobacteria bacterium]